MSHESMNIMRAALPHAREIHHADSPTAAAYSHVVSAPFMNASIVRAGPFIRSDRATEEEDLHV